MLVIFAAIPENLGINPHFQLIDRVGFMNSGFCYGFGKEEPSDPDMTPNKFQIMVYWFLSPGNFLD